MWYLIDNLQTGNRTSRDYPADAREYARRQSRETGDAYIIREKPSNDERAYPYACYYDGVEVEWSSDPSTYADLRANVEYEHQRALDAEKRARNAEGTVEMYGQRVYELNKRLDEQKAAPETFSYRELARRLEVVTNQLAERDTELEDARAYSARLQAELENRRLEVAELEDRRDELKVLIAELESDAGDLEDELDEYADDTAEHYSRIAYLEGEVAAYARRAGHAEEYLGLSGLSGAEIMRRWEHGINPNTPPAPGTDRSVIADPPLRFESDGTTQGDMERLEREVEYLRAVRDGQRRRYEMLEEERDEYRRAWYEEMDDADALRADADDLRGVIRHLIQDRDKERARADEFEECFKYWVNTAVDLKVLLEHNRDARNALSIMETDLATQLSDLEREFARYREYTTAGFKTLYHERRYGPAAGAPGTEELLIFDGSHYRIVYYPLPSGPPAPGGEVTIKADTSRFGKSMRAAGEYMRDLASKITFSDAGKPVGTEATSPVGRAMQTPIIPETCEFDPPVSGCPGAGRCGCSPGYDSAYDREVRGEW